MFKSADIARSLREMQEGGATAEKVAGLFWKFIKKYSLQSVAGSVIKELEKQKDEQRSSDLFVRASHPLSAVSELDLRNLTGAGKEAKLVFQEEKELLGGFIARFKGVEYEGSFSKKTENLERLIKE